MKIWDSECHQCHHVIIGSRTYQNFSKKIEMSMSSKFHDDMMTFGHFLSFQTLLSSKFRDDMMTFEANFF